MRILHTVEFYEPRRGGAEEVVKQLSERLAALGHEVVVATTYDPRRAGYIGGVKIEQFRIAGNAAMGLRGSQAEIRRYHELLGSGFDVVMNYAAQSWTTDLALQSLYSISAKKVLVPCGYSGLHNPRYREYFAVLPEKLKAYDALVYMGKEYQDILWGREHGLRDREVYIPNGAAAEEFLGADIYNFKKRFAVTTPHMALCVSNHYRAKGHSFVIEAFRKMHRADTTLVIIGAPFVATGLLRKLAHFALDYCGCFFASLFNRRIKLISTNDRRAVVSAYRGADVFLFGSEVECAPLVMYESFASKTPFITRRVGNVGDHAQDLKIISSTEEMARVANSILDDAETGKEIAARAHITWERNHQWSAISATYQDLYTRLSSK